MAVLTVQHPPPHVMSSATPRSANLAPAKTVGQLGPYVIESLLGQGAAAAVYRAGVESPITRQMDGQLVEIPTVDIPQVSRKPRVALKVLGQAGKLHPELRASFERERHALSRVDHPNVVQLFDAGEIQGRPFTAMEFIWGRTLDKQLAVEEKLAESIAVDIAQQTARALAHIHERGIVHRDVKPANLMITTEGQVKLLDFGVSLDLHKSGKPMDEADAVFGTPGYLAPEQTQAEAAVDGRADLYSLGVVLYRMVTGRKPFYGSREQVFQAHNQEPPPPPSSVAHVSPELEAVILKVLAKNPTDRYQTGTDVAEALDRVQLVEPPEPRGFFQRLLHWR